MPAVLKKWIVLLSLTSRNEWQIDDILVSKGVCNYLCIEIKCSAPSPHFSRCWNISSKQANNDFIKIRITAALYTFATCTLDDPYGITNGSDDGQLLKSVRSFFQTLSEIIQSFVATIVKIYSCQMKSFQRNEKRYGFKIIRFNVAIS